MDGAARPPGHAPPHARALRHWQNEDGIPGHSYGLWPNSVRAGDMTERRVTGRNRLVSRAVGSGSLQWRGRSRAVQAVQCVRDRVGTGGMSGACRPVYHPRACSFPSVVDSAMHHCASPAFLPFLTLTLTLCQQFSVQPRRLRQY